MSRLKPHSLKIPLIFIITISIFVTFLFQPVFAIPFAQSFQGYFTLSANKTQLQANDTVAITVNLTTTGEVFDSAVALLEWDSAQFQHVSTIGQLNGEFLSVYPNNDLGKRVMLHFSTGSVNLMTTPADVTTPFAVVTLKALVDDPSSPVLLSAIPDDLALHFESSVAENSIDQSYTTPDQVSLRFVAATPSPLPSLSPSPTVFPTATPAPSVTPSPRVSPVPTPIPTVSPSPSPRPTVSPRPTPSVRPTPQPTVNPSQKPSPHKLAWFELKGPDQVRLDKRFAVQVRLKAATPIKSSRILLQFNPERLQVERIEDHESFSKTHQVRHNNRMGTITGSFAATEQEPFDGNHRLITVYFTARKTGDARIRLVKDTSENWGSKILGTGNNLNLLKEGEAMLISVIPKRKHN